MDTPIVNNVNIFINNYNNPGLIKVDCNDSATHRLMGAKFSKYEEYLCFASAELGIVGMLELIYRAYTYDKITVLGPLISHWIELNHKNFDKPMAYGKIISRKEYVYNIYIYCNINNFANISSSLNFTNYNSEILEVVRAIILAELNHIPYISLIWDRAWKLFNSDTYEHYRKYIIED